MTLKRGYDPFNAKPLVPASEARVVALEASVEPITGPPASSPTPDLTGGVRTILGRHPSVPLARTYDIYLSDTNASAPDAAHLVATTNAIIWQLSEVPDVMAVENPDLTLDTSLQPGVTYYVAVIAKNDLGAAAPSAWVSVSLRLVSDEDISAAYAYLGRVTVDQLDGGTLSSAVNLTGILKTRASEMDPGGELDIAGLRGYATPETVGEPAPLQVEIAFDGRPSYFAGDISARKFDAYQGADLHGDANNIKSDGGLTLEGGVSSGSSAAPSVTQGLSSVALTRPTATAAWGSSVQFDAAAVQAFNWDVPSGKWIAAQNVTGKGVVNWRIGTDGVVSFLNSDDGWGHYGWLRDPNGANNTFYVLTAQVGNPSNLWLSGLKLGASSKLQIPRLNTTETPVGTWASTGQLRVAERQGSTIVTRSYSISGANPVLSSTTTSDAWWPSSNKLGSINVTQGPGFAAAQSAYAPRNAPTSRVRVASGGATELPDYEWNTPAVGFAGICPNGPDTASSGGSWYGLGTDNRLYVFTNSTWTGSFTKRVIVGTTAATSTAETQVGSKVAVNWQRRHQMTITAPPLVDPAIRAGVYAVEWPSGTPTDSQMFRHGYTPAGGRVLTISTVLTSGSPPGTAPTASPYPVASPAWIRSEALASGGGPMWELGGDGTFNPPDTGWLNLGGSVGSGITLTERQYRVRGGMVQVRFAGTLTAAISVPTSGNIGDIAIGTLPAGALPGGGGISAIAPFPVDIGGVIAHAYIYNGGSIAIANAESRGATYPLGAAGTEVSGVSPLLTVNS